MLSETGTNALLVSLLHCFGETGTNALLVSLLHSILWPDHPLSENSVVSIITLKNDNHRPYGITQSFESRRHAGTLKFFAGRCEELQCRNG